MLIAKDGGDLAPESNPFKIPRGAEEFIPSCRIRSGAGFQRDRRACQSAPCARTY